MTLVKLSTTPSTSPFLNRRKQIYRWLGRRQLQITNQQQQASGSGAYRQNLFNNISPVYDQLNDLLSLGQHRVWKRMAVKFSGAKQGDRALDLCCGTGDLTYLLAQAVGPSGSTVGLDFAQEMLQDAEKRLQHASPYRYKQQSQIEWVLGDALRIPFEINSFDAVTMGYGLRNVTNIPQSLQEINRVLKTGGKFAALDFNKSENFLVSQFQKIALERVVVPVADSYGLREQYEYLWPSIQSFCTGKEQEKLALEAGFGNVKHYEIGGGLMGILVGQKI